MFLTLSQHSTNSKRRGISSTIKGLEKSGKPNTGAEVIANFNPFMASAASSVYTNSPFLGS